MKTLCSSGYKISTVDQKALDHYLLITPKEYAQGALNGMINKAIKTIMRDYYQIYKSKQLESVSADLTIVLPAIISMEEFKPYNRGTPDQFDKTFHGILPPVGLTIDRIEPISQEIWLDGFTIQDHEEVALNAFYSNPEEMLRWFMTNFIYQYRCEFVKENEAKMIADPEVTSIPSKQDAFINMVCALPNYKSRLTSES